MGVTGSSWSACCCPPELWSGKVCRHRASVPDRSLDTRGGVGLVDCHSWACRKAPGGSEELTPLGRLEAKNLVDPTLSLGLKHGNVSLRKKIEFKKDSFEYKR